MNSDLIYIDELSEFDLVLDRANTITQSDGYSAAIRYLNSIRLNLRQQTPNDPLSDEYRDHVVELYKAVSGRPSYDPEKFEAANLDLRQAIASPWPYSSGNADVVGSYFMGVAHITRILGIYGCKIVLEYGVGWGHTAIMMANSGIDVTSVDIEPVFLDRLIAETASAGPTIKTFRGKFGDLPDNPKKFDAFVFFECFHHCLDFVEVVRTLKSRLNPGGKILLGGEPMLTPSDPPWGLRLDGHAVWAIRTHGWLELGFREDFLLEFFKNEGFTATAHPCPAAGEAGFVWVFHLD